ncbi:MAG TPA: response regulator [Pyrinomonadaceae bacterium]|jgi:two-component system chemotaxis response regulator CheY|nr:response regulator [Pyrinomonadaceae bacterium]
MFSTTIHATSRILIADDDPVIRHLVTRLVEKANYKTVVCADGREAARVLQSDSNFCGAIFDMMMPHLEGLELIRFMRTEKRLMRIPVLMITSESDLKLMANSFSAGATLFLPKPFTADQFHNTFKLLLSNSSNKVVRTT